MLGGTSSVWWSKELYVEAVSLGSLLLRVPAFVLYLHSPHDKEYTTGRRWEEKLWKRRLGDEEVLLAPFHRISRTRKGKLTEKQV